MYFIRVGAFSIRREKSKGLSNLSNTEAGTQKSEKKEGRGKKLNTLQKYIILFFIVALVLVIMAGIFQQKLRGNSENYESIIAQKDNTILTNSSMMDDLQNRYDALVKERDAQKQLLDAQQKELEAAQSLQIQSAAESALFTAQDQYNKGKYSACRETLAGINPDALSPAARIIYDDLNKKVNR